MRIGRSLARNLLHDYNTGLGQRTEFDGVVGKQANTLDSEVIEDGARQAEIPAVCFKTKCVVCRNGVKTLILQRIGLQFCHQAYPASFLLFVDQETAPFRGDSSHRKFQLFAAVATERSQNVTCNALGVNPNKWHSS